MSKVTTPVIVTVEGLSEVIGNLRKEKTFTEKMVAQGLIKAGTFIYKESRKIVPMQRGILRASAYVRPIGSLALKSFEVIVGYTAGYAVYVHEILTNAHGAAFNRKHAAKIRHMIAIGKSNTNNGWFFRKPEEQAKFLERPVRDNRDEIFRIIGYTAKRP